MRVLEAEGERDRLAKLLERLAVGEFKLAPDLPGVRWSIEAAEDANADRVSRRRDRRSGGGHLRELRDEWPVGLTLANRRPGWWPSWPIIPVTVRQR
jgi:hypothetical protein